MYLPPAFRQDDPAAIASLIAAHPFGLLITQGEAGPIADPLPFLFDPPRDGTPGMLRGHLARANPHAKALLDGGPRPALVVFQGPAAYVSPSWYPGKAETGKVVPTWNYAMVQAAGPVRAIDDAAWLRDLIEALTNSQEADRAAPWAVGDAPADFIDGLVRAIVGVEVTVEALYGKWKLSQNRSEADRAGVIAGLSDEPGEQARAMAAMMAATQPGPSHG